MVKSGRGWVESGWMAGEAAEGGGRVVVSLGGGRREASRGQRCSGRGVPSGAAAHVVEIGLRQVEDGAAVGLRAVVEEGVVQL